MVRNAVSGRGSVSLSFLNFSIHIPFSIWVIDKVVHHNLNSRARSYTTQVIRTGDFSFSTLQANYRFRSSGLVISRVSSIEIHSINLATSNSDIGDIQSVIYQVYTSFSLFNADLFMLVSPWVGTHFTLFAVELALLAVALNFQTIFGLEFHWENTDFRSTRPIPKKVPDIALCALVLILAVNLLAV